MYLQSIALNIRAALPDEVDVPADSQELFILYALLVRTKGQKTTASDVHDAWTAWMLGKNPRHPSLIPFNKLDSGKKNEDEPFLEAIRTVAEKMRDDSESAWS